MPFGGDEMTEPIISLRNLDKHYKLGNSFFKKKSKIVRAVDDFSVDINEGEIVGVIGESGSGKTTLSRLILGLTKATSGDIIIDGINISKVANKKIREIRNNFAIVFQDPASNLNPRQIVESSIMRPLIIRGVSRSEARQKAIEAMERVKMDRTYLKSYPHQLSGGQQQRIAIARALVMEPKIMVLDEPTSALDISVQAEILNLLLDLQEEFNLTYLVVTHDLNVIKYISDSIIVMYAGRLIEYGSTEKIIGNPTHPYMKLLIESVPVLDPLMRGEQDFQQYKEFELVKEYDACCLVNRCPYVQERCRKEKPEIEEISEGHFSACFRGKEFYKKLKNKDKV